MYRGGFLLLALFAALLIAATVHPASRLSPKVFALPVVVWVGVRSYGIYLWHWPIYMVTRPHADVPAHRHPVARPPGRADVRVRGAVLQVRRGAHPARRARTPVGGVPASEGRAAPPARHGVRRGRQRPRGRDPRDRRRLRRRGADTPAGGPADAGRGRAPADHHHGRGDPQPVRRDHDHGGAGRWHHGPVGDDHHHGCARGGPRHRGRRLRDARRGHTRSRTPSAPDRILVDAEESRQFSAGVDKLQEYRDTGQLGDEVVVQLGTNGTVNPDDFDRMMDVLKGVKRVVIVNAKVPRPWEDQVNEALADGVKRIQEHGGARRLAQHRRRPPRVLLGRRHPPPSGGRHVLRPADRRIPLDASGRTMSRYLRRGARPVPPLISAISAG